MSNKINIPNDNISKMIMDFNPEFIDTDDFLDIVQWNLRWFNDREKSRANKIEQVLSSLNSDVFVFQEVAEGSLDDIAKKLSDSGKGSYVVKYGLTGGQQRIAIMWDMEWIRAKDEVTELFGKRNVTTPSGKDVFPRLPLWGYFYCKSTISNKRGFDFQLVGLHLKSQMDRSGTGEAFLQRTLSASKLSDWLIRESNHFDSDTILLGDWNEPPYSKAWEAFDQLENEKRVKFKKINDATDFSHLYYKNRKEIGSLLDLKVVTSPFADEMNKKTQGVIHWLALEDLLSKDANVSAIKKVISEIKKEVTDHMPVLTRFGIKE